MLRSAWYDDTVLPRKMVDGVTDRPGLEYSPHFLMLDELMKRCVAEHIADVGCGAGELGRVYTNLNYTGFDLPHIIKGVAKKVNPTLEYIEFDAYESDYSIFKNYDLIVCNSFLSEIESPLEILKKILNNTTKYLLIHRQCFSDANKYEDYITYGGLDAKRAYICEKDFYDTISEYTIIKEINNNDYGKSILIKNGY